MQSSFTIKVGVTIALWWPSSQTLPILDHATDLIPKSSVPIRNSPPIHSHVERTSENGDKDVIPFHGVYRRQLTSLRDDSNRLLESRDVPNSKPEKPLFNNPNTPTLPIQAPDPTTTLTTTTTIISTTIAPPTQTRIN